MNETNEEETHSEFSTNPINSTEETFKNPDIMVTTIISDMNPTHVNQIEPISFHPTSKLQSSLDSDTSTILESPDEKKKR